MPSSSKQEPLVTQELIINAARYVFIRKGYSGARMQEIADEAGINKALLFYYFRSKENLFHAIFTGVLEQIQKEIINILNSEMDLFDKLRFFFNFYIGILQKNSFVPAFLIHEVNQNAQILVDDFKKAGFTMPVHFIKQINRGVKQGRIKAVDPVQLLLNMLSLAIYPIMAEPLIKGVLNIDDDSYNEIIEKRKTELADWVIDSIKK
ncbi:MAG: TetR/AcrR family transcriptional regulator [Bacteroidales bacterium]|nr:TetR/AcrR family transcriptional regulator [Bacteroidales bacterium]